MTAGCGWTWKKTTQRAIEELEAKSYIEVKRATNQHGLTLIKILKHDLEEPDSAEDKNYPSKPDKVVAEDIAEDNAEDKNYPSKPASSQNPQDLQFPKKLRSIEEKKEAEEEAAASRRENPNPSLQQEGKEAWEVAGIPPGGSQRFIATWERFYANRPEGELVSVTMGKCLDYCQANGIKPTPPFCEAKTRIKQQEADDDSEVARVASFEDRQAEAERMCAEMEARHEAERAKFNALPPEGKVAELKAELASTEEMIAGLVKRGVSSGAFTLELKNQQATLERQIAELSSPDCQEEISLTAEEERQLLSQFPEAWDAVDTAETQVLGMAA